MPTSPPKTAATTFKRGAGRTRATSSGSRRSSSVSITVGGNGQDSVHSEALKIITEVDGMRTQGKSFANVHLFCRVKYR